MRSSSNPPSPSHPFAPSAPHPSLPHLLAWVLACATLPLVSMGGLVTSYRAGMAVRDWPNTFGYNLFLYPLESWIDVFDVLLEHSHRLIGAAVGLVAIALAIVLWVVDRRPAAKRLGIAAVVGVSLQGTLGGLRVILDETLLADLHGCTAALYFALAAALVTYTSPAWRVAGDGGRGMGDGGGGRAKPQAAVPCCPLPATRHPPPATRHLPWLPTATAIAFYLQIVLGAQLRHLTPQQGPGWFALWVWLHVIMAGLLVAAVVWLLVLTSRRSGAEWMLSRRAKWLAAALAVQLTLAAATWVTHYGWPAWLTGAIGAIPYTVVASGRLQAFTTTAHVVVGSLCLAAALSLVLWSRRLAFSPRTAVCDAAQAPRLNELPSAACHAAQAPRLNELPSAIGCAAQSPRLNELPSAIGCAAQAPRLNGLPTAHWYLIRPRIVGMVLATMTVAALAAGRELPAWPVLVHALVGSALVIAGAIALNERAERSSDAMMARTALRPLPSGRISAAQAGWFGAVASALGLGYLGLLSDWVTLALAAISWAVYVSLYTPMKTRSLWQTPVGALAGAMPVLLGASAAGGLSSIVALALFGVLYCWQFPHAMAIAWLYREQFAAAGLKVASVTDPSGRTAGALALAGAAVLLPVSLVPWWAGAAGGGYALAALGLGLGYAAASLAFSLRRDQITARLLLRSSLAYLLGLLAAMLLARQ